jgi:hypothetical protein
MAFERLQVFLPDLLGNPALPAVEVPASAVLVDPYGEDQPEVPKKVDQKEGYIPFAEFSNLPFGR